MSASPRPIVIVGAGIAGDSCVTELRRQGHSGRIIMIGEEPWRPYERPPLSKIALREPHTIVGSFFLKPEDWYEANAVELLLSRTATHLDTQRNVLELDSREEIGFDRLVIATGAEARRLRMEGSDAANVSYLRTKDDARRLAGKLAAGTRLVVVGMGVIGCEVAATARQLGCEVHGIEPAACPMVRTLASEMGNWLAAIHQLQGVRVSYGHSLRKLVLDKDCVRAVESDNGEIFECDAVCIGVGSAPRVELAVRAGLAVDDGILVDSQNRTGSADIFAIGDVARVPALGGGFVRYETYQNAADQGAIAARTILGVPSQDPIPCSFWSEQYDHSIQVIGSVSDHLTTAERAAEGGGFVKFYLASGTVAGAVAVDAPREMAIIRRMVSAKTAVDAADLSSPDISLRNLCR